MQAIRLVSALVIGLAALAGCAELDESYGPRAVTAPKPLSSGFGGYAAAPLDASGVVVVTGGAQGRALTDPEVYGGPPQLGRVRPADDGASALPDAEGVSLNFVDTAISEVVDVVLGQLLAVNYVIDPRVQGTVTARTSDPIATGDLLPVLENILAANGAAIVDTGAMLSVVPIEVARTLPRVVVTPGRSVQPRGFGTYFIPLRHASAAVMQETIAAQISPGSQIFADPARNILIFTGPEQEARSVVQMANVLDIDMLAGRSFALLPLDAAAPARIAAEIEALAEAGEAPVADFGVLPIERMNAVLVIANSTEQVRRLAYWVDRLDRADAGAGREIVVYRVRNGLASELADVLEAVFASAAAGIAPPAEVAPGLEPVEVGLPAEETGVGPAETLAGETFAEDFDVGPAAGAGPGAPDLRIVPDDERNAIIISGAPDEVSVIIAALRRLDTEPTQVLIEATIAEVMLTDDLEYGLRWAFESGEFNAILTDSSAGVVGSSFPGLNLIFDSDDALVVLRALSEVTDVEVVSSPQLMVLENQTARLQIGDQVPVTTEQVVPITDVDAPIVNAVTYIDTGVILEVTPRVNAQGTVALHIVQEVSDAVRNETSGIDSPTIQQRRVESTIAVQSGQTAALGGLIRGRRQVAESGIPVAKDIPIIGNLFKTTARRGDRTELLVLITPRVLRDSAETSEIAAELRARLIRLQDVLPPAL